MSQPAPGEGRYAETVFSNGYEFAQGSGYALPVYPFQTPPEVLAGRTGRHSIVIVGGGISGLTLACALARLGVPAILLDEDDTVGVKGAASRGICYTQKSLEIFERLGVYPRIAAKGVQWSVGRTFAGHEEVYAFDLREQASFNLSSQPPFINIQQFYVEGYLVERIQALGHVDIRWRNRVVGFEQDAQGALLTVSTPAGDYGIRAEHVVDATGSRSPFRQWLGATCQTRKGDDRWCIADVRFADHPPSERHTWIEAPFNEDRAVWQHLMADGVWRIDYQMPNDADPDYVSREDVVRERLARQFGADTHVEIVWVGPYAYRNEVIDQMRHGRVFFVGDAAKVVSPFGARGGNTGISDADNLAWKLAAVHSGRANARLLDSFHDERHEAALENARVTHRTSRFLRPANPVERLMRRAAIGLARQYPFARHLVNTGRMAVANSYSRSRACGLGGGRSVQNVDLQWADDTAGSLNDLLRWADGRLLLLIFGPLNPHEVQRLCKITNSAPVCAVQVLAAGERASAVEQVRDPQARVRGACHSSDSRWALVRPDSYLAAQGAQVDSALIDDIGLALGIAPDRVSRRASQGARA